MSLAYNVDICFCIDNLNSVEFCGESIKKILIDGNFISHLSKSFFLKRKILATIRLKFIFFNNVQGDFLESDFFILPCHEKSMERFFQNLNSTSKYHGFGLETLTLAMKSDWIKDGDRQRHVIVIWSDASTHPLEVAKRGTHVYNQKGMPKDFNELTDWWDGQNYMRNRSAKKLVIFAPTSGLWAEIATHWENTIHIPRRADEGITEADFQTALNSTVNSI